MPLMTSYQVMARIVSPNLSTSKNREQNRTPHVTGRYLFWDFRRQVCLELESALFGNKLRAMARWQLASRISEESNSKFNLTVN